MKQGKLIRRAVSAALAGCMMFTFSAPALAESTDALMQLSTAAKSAVSVLDAENGDTANYGFTIDLNGTTKTVNESNCKDIFEDKKLSYDPITNKLTNNGTIGGKLTIDAPNVDVELTGNSSVIDGYSTNLNIKNARNVTLSTNSFSVVGGLYSGNVEINCSGKLTIKNSDFTWPAIKGDLTVHNALEILVEGRFSTVVGGDVKIECACPATFKNNQNGGIAKSITYAGDYVYYTSDATDAEAVDPNVTSIPAKTAKYVRIVPKVSYTITADGATITVDGKVVNSAFAGEKVTVTAAGRKNAEFTGWTDLDSVLTSDQLTAKEVTFTMPDKNVTLTPNYKQYYTITSTDDVTIKVDNDRSTATAKALEGQHIVALANNKDGYVFENWEVDGVTLNTSNSVNYTNFEMPAKNVTLTPHYAKLHTIEVVNGTANITSAKKGTKVTVTADDRPGYVFDHWESEQIRLTTSEATNPSLTFAMPDEDVVLKAVPKTLYTITVEGGTVNNAVSARVKSGDPVTVVPEDKGADWKFIEWEVINAPENFSIDTSNPALQFNMPVGNVTLKAVQMRYRTITVNNGLGQTVKTDALRGETYTFTADKLEGQRFDYWEVTDPDGTRKLMDETINITVPKGNVTLTAVYNDYHNITVEGGYATPDRAIAGTQITLTPNLPDDQEFDYWYSTDINLREDQRGNPNLTFKMRDFDIKITAVPKQLYFVDLEDADTTANGEDTRVEVKTGKEVVLVAPEREGFRFNHWEVTSGTVGLIDADKTTAYFTMKSENVRIKAIYDEYHTITMVDGKGTAYDADGKEITSAVVGDKITIVAKDRDSHEFNHWEIDPDNVILEDPNADKTAFTMPDEPVSVEAKYKHLQSITMNHGTAYDEDFSETDIAKAKQTITIKAEDRYADGLVFDHWAVDTDNVILADEYDEKTTFEMVNGAVELTAHYKARVTVFSVPAKFEEGIGEHSDETWEKVGETATITAKIDEETFPGMEFDYWEVIPTDLDIGNIHSQTISFEVPECEVKLVAHWKASGMNPIVDPDEDLDPGFGVETESSDGGAGGAGAAIAGVAIGGAAVWGGYEIATRVILHGLLPEGVAIPANRGQLALLIWTEKGKPEPAAQPAFADITDAEQAKAAQWCVEQGLLDAREGKFESDGWMPKFKTIEIWNKAFPKK